MPAPSSRRCARARARSSLKRGRDHLELGRHFVQDSGADLSLTDMADAMKKVTSGEYQEMNAKLSKHLNVTQECMGKFSRANLMEISRLEQMLATGTTEEGQTVKPARALEETAAALKDIKPEMSEVRSRLVAIYAISQRPVSEDDRERFVAEAGLTAEEEQLLASIIRLTASLPASKPVEKKKFFGIGKREPKAAAVAAPDDSEYSSSRYVCPLRDVAEQLVEGKLSGADFACVNGDVSATTAEKEPVVRSARQTHNRYGASSKKKSTHTGGRVILFVAGGCSDAELRAAYEVQGKADVVIGSTSILAPRDFLAELGRDSVL